MKSAGGWVRGLRDVALLAVQLLAGEFLAGVLVGGISLAAAQAPPPPDAKFQPPLICGIDSGCRIQHYVDQDPGPGARDYACGHLSYDGHNGVDFAIANLAVMQRGVDVVAAAAGVVTHIHDGEADISMDETGPGDSIDGINGNSVTLTHKGGWRSLYAHLRRGSLRVRTGQEVAAGASLGQVGLSGNSNFPHLHFTLHYRDWIIDPFTGAPQASGCAVANDKQDGGGAAAQNLWGPDATGLLAYRPGGLIDAGFTAASAPSQDLLQGLARETALPADSPNFTFWAAAWGLRRGDSETLRVYGPDGNLVGETFDRLEQEGALWVRQASLQASPPWPRGTYRATYKVERGGSDKTLVILDIERNIEVR